MELLSQILAIQLNSQMFQGETIFDCMILLMVILVVPILFERLRLPGLVGLVCAGVVLGSSGWNLVETESPILNLLSDVGLVYLMFIAGLEADIEMFRRRKIRSLGLGCLTFSLPLIFGTFLGRSFDFDWNVAILIGALFASHTLLVYPVINRLGALNNQAVNAAVGATIFTDIGTLLILAVCITSHGGGFDFFKLLALLSSLLIYAIIVLFAFDWAGKEFFRRSGDDEGNQLLFVLLAVFLAAIVAQVMGIQDIIAAFLVGLAVNDTVGSGPVKEKVVFLGSAVFIPIFFVNLGLQLKLSTFASSINSIWFTLCLVMGVIASKFIAAFLAKLIYRYNWRETLTIWSVNIPQVSATLAATLVGYRFELLNVEIFNSAIVLMLVTASIGPMITSRLAMGLTASPSQPQESTTPVYPPVRQTDNPFTIVVPIHNPQTQQYLIEIAALLARQNHGKIVPLAIATATAQLDAPQMEVSVQRSERLLAKAIALSRILDVEAKALLRIDDAFAQGITRAAREQNANLIVMGWGKRTGLRARLFGNVIDSVLWSSHCPVAVARLVESPHKIQRILVPVENLTAPTLQPVQFAQMLAEPKGAQVTVLNVCERRTSSSKIAWRRSQLSGLVSQLDLLNPPEIQIIAHENVAQAILQAARLYDLVVLPFIRTHTSAGGLAISDVITQLANQLTCSIVMLGEPQSSQTVVLPTDTPSTKAVV
ncbi:MAG: cation:proton antiporter [Nostocaceae cyanobacterium]|nr:cation:proton antiporter [Nostocaceae cyanobacterium]